MTAPVPAPRLYNLGAGPRPILPRLAQASAFEGWEEIRVDIDPVSQPDILADLRLIREQLPAGDADLVYCSHVLEHFHDHEVPAVLAGILHLLKPGAPLVLRVPDLGQVAALLKVEDPERTLYTSPAGPVAALDVIYGHRASIQAGNPFMAHHTGFTESSLARRLIGAGFAEVHTVGGPSVEICAVASTADLAMTPQITALMNHVNPDAF